MLKTQTEEAGEFLGEEEGESPLWTAPSVYGSREEIVGGFRGVKRLLWTLLVLTIVNSAAIVLLSGDRSLVVGLSSDGHMQVLTPLADGVFRKNLERISRTFVQDFLTNLTAYDSFEISYRIGKALAVMTPDLRLQMKRAIETQNLVQSVSRAKIHTILSVERFSMHPVRRGIWSVEVSGARTTYGPGSSAGSVKGFSARLILSRGTPTPGNPYGLWVSRYQEEAPPSQAQASSAGGMAP